MPRVPSIAVALILLISPVLAHDHNRPNLNEWYKGLHSGNGHCCDEGEALKLSEDDWAIRGTYYRVKVPIDYEQYDKVRNGEATLDSVPTEWVDVPEAAVLTIENEEGVPMVWPYYGPLHPGIRCFFPGSGT